MKNSVFKKGSYYRYVTIPQNTYIVRVDRAYAREGIFTESKEKTGVCAVGGVVYSSNSNDNLLPLLRILRNRGWSSTCPERYEEVPPEEVTAYLLSNT